MDLDNCKEMNDLVDDLIGEERQQKYHEILKSEKVRFCVVTRKHSGRKFFGYGSTYTEAILKAYERVHTEEFHLAPYSPCMICNWADKVKQLCMAEDDVAVSCGNLFNEYLEH